MDFQGKNGSFNIPNGLRLPQSEITANKTFDSNESGQEFEVKTDGIELVLDAEAKDGDKFTIVMTGVAGAVGYTVAPESGGGIFGKIGTVTFSGTADALIRLVAGTSVKGDKLVLTKRSDGWYAEGTGIYANS